MTKHYFQNENLNSDPYKPTFRHTWRHVRVWSLSVPGALHVALYHFWFENWNPDPGKPTFRHTWRHIGVWPPYLYLVNFQDQPSATSRWPDTISDIRIEIFALTKLHLDIHEGILEFDLYICIWSGSRWPHIIFGYASIPINLNFSASSYILGDVMIIMRWCNDNYAVIEFSS